MYLKKNNSHKEPFQTSKMQVRFYRVECKLDPSLQGYSEHFQTSKMEIITNHFRKKLLDV